MYPIFRRDFMLTSERQTLDVQIKADLIQRFWLVQTSDEQLTWLKVYNFLN